MVPNCNPQVLRLAFAGQSLLGHDVSNIRSNDFLSARSLIQSCDAAFTNFEGCVNAGEPTKVRFFHAVEPAVMNSLSWLGFRLVSLANNHAFDSGTAGIIQTLDEAQKLGLAAAGTGNDLTHAGSAAYLDTPKGKVALIAAVTDQTWLPDVSYAVDGSSFEHSRPGVNPLRVDSVVNSLPREEWQILHRLASTTGASMRNRREVACGWCQSDAWGIDFFGTRFACGLEYGQNVHVNTDDYERLLDAVVLASQIADIVVVSHHDHVWANDWQDVLPWKRRLAHDCIDRGASVFVGHGVPALSGIEIYEGSPIMYSLGNFLFHETTCGWNLPEIWRSVIVTVSFRPSGKCSLNLHPIAITDTAPGSSCRSPAQSVPCLARGANARAILQSIADLSEPFGTQIEIIRDVGYIT